MTGSTLMSVALALLCVAVPLLAGVAIGRTLQRRRSMALLAVLATAAVTYTALEGLPQIGTWDVISVGALLVIGTLFGAAGIDRRSAIPLLVSYAVAFAVLEIAVRCWLPTPPRFPSPGEADFVLEPSVWDAGCAVLYEHASVDDAIRALRPRERIDDPGKSAPLVVHLGDSLTHGDGVLYEQTFTALLDAHRSTVAHRNYGVWAVGTDFQWLLLRRILAEHSPAMVVLHVYVGNDVYDIDRPYACCEAGPLLDYGADGPAPRCASARWSFPLSFRLSHSPPPYPLRVATGWSYTARHVAAAFSRLALWFEPRADYIRAEGEATETGWEHFEQILTKLRDELPTGIELVVDILPNRQALEADDPTASPSYRAGKRVAQITARLGIRTLDAWDVLAAAVKRDGARRYFLDEHDIHFTPAGHRLVADWLETQLRLEPPMNTARADARNPGP